MAGEDHVYHHHRRDMRAAGQLLCPYCGVTLAEGMLAENASRCPFCHGQCRIVGFGHDRRVVQQAPETLYLPRGSIRALSTILLSLATWVLILSGRPVPEYVFGLLLTLIGYYFALRKKAQRAAGVQGGAGGDGNAEHPLYLPKGCIRIVLIGGFTICGIVILAQDRMLDPKHLQFFPLLAGLIVGHLWSRATAGSRGEPLFVTIAHAKGILVSLASVALGVMLLGDLHVAHPYAALGLSCGISFYFGTKS